MLLIDNSNTRTKLMVMRDGTLCPDSLRILPTKELNEETLCSVTAEFDFSGVLVASVVPSLHSVFRDAFADRADVRFVRHDMPLPICFDYPGVATLGADRIANAVAVALLYPLPCVAVDAGTAITFDVVLSGTSKPVFVGGAIAPGVSTMAHSLGAGTAMLPDLQVDFPESSIGRNTAEAISSGIMWGVCGMVSGLLCAMEKQCGYALRAIATGGDARRIAPHVAKIVEVDSLLTFRGLQQLALYCGG